MASGAAVSGVAIAGCIGGDDDDDDDDNGVDLVDPEEYQYDREHPDDEDRADHLHVTQQQERGEEFDPIISNDAYSSQVFSWVFDSMYTWDDGLNLEPQLAVDHPDVERDNTRFIYEIHDGVEFSDGTEMTAEDVEHSYIAPVLEQTDNAPSFSMIEASEIVDDYTVQIDLDSPYGPWQMQTHAVAVVSKENRLTDVDAYDEATPDMVEANPDELTQYVNEDYNQDPVGNTIGSGPFEFEEFTLNEEAVLTRRDDYWGEPHPHLEQVTFEAAEDPASRVSQMRAADTDVIAEIPDDDWSVLEDEEDVRLHMAESPTYMYMAFNCTPEADTSSPEVRRAVCQSFSMTDFVETHASNTAMPMTTPVPPIVNEVDGWGFPMDEWHEDLYPSYDPDSAEELLDEHAPDDFEPTIICPDGIRADLAERIATRLDEIGYGANVQQMDFGTLVESYTTGDPDDYEMYLLGWTGGPDPDFYLYSLFHEDSAGVTQGHFYEGSDNFHDNILDARNSGDIEERYDLYEEVLIEILEELPALPAFTLHNTMAAGSHVKDLHAHPSVQTNPRLVSDYGNVWTDN